MNNKPAQDSPNVDDDRQIALIVDLDGTLVLTDTLWESVLRICHTKPWLLFVFPIWLLQGGRARLKAEISKRISIDPSSLPYRTKLIEIITDAKNKGRETILATAANENIGQSISNHLGIFDHVIASNETQNLKSHQKLEVILKHLEDKPFDYVGDSKADIPIWTASRKAFSVSNNNRIKKKINSLDNGHNIDSLPKPGVRIIAKTVRLHQWAKNILLFVPLILSQQLNNSELITALFLAFLSFGLCASSTYIWNDLLDLPNDRKHPSKKKRALASGAISIPVGIALSLGLLVTSFTLSITFLPSLFTVMLGGYIALTLSYSFYFKRKLMADVLMLGGLYTYRIIIGAVAISVVVSPWLLAFSIFFFLSLAFVKRYIDLLSTTEDTGEQIGGRGYFVRDLSTIQSMGTSASYLSVLVLALYINSPVVTTLYSKPEGLWLLCPLLLYWLSRIWFLASRNHMPEDPILFAIKDKISYLVGILSFVVLLASS